MADSTEVILLVLVLASGLFLYLRPSTSSKLPPVVPGYPVIGSLIDVARVGKSGQMHLWMQSHARNLGDVFRLKVGPVTVTLQLHCESFIDILLQEYFINSDRAVKEILDRGSAQTSERPPWYFSNEYVCNKRNLLLLHASDPRWKSQRKVATNEMLSPQMADSALP